MNESNLDFGVFTLRRKPVVSGNEKPQSGLEDDQPRIINSQAHKKFVDYMFSIVENNDTYDKEH